MMNVIAPPVSTAHLSVGLDNPLPGELFTGKGAVLLLKGWCYSADALVRALDVMMDDRVIAVPNHSWGRTDVFARDCPTDDPSGNSLLSGFSLFVDVDPVESDRNVALSLRAVLENGEAVTHDLGAIRLRSGHGANPATVTWPSTGPRVVICMAIFHPPLELFLRQIASIIAQTHTNWICIVSDDNTDNEYFDRVRSRVRTDARFIFFHNPSRRSFYDNFQHVLSRTPLDADFVALSDQDDVWRSDKLESLIGAFRPETQLAYSDARIVDATGAVRSPTFWTSRRNNYTDLAALLVANTITGAASMIRASLLDDVLPFPRPVGPAFHDHWMGLVARLRGGIAYVDRPLYDYVQHRDGVIGHNYNRAKGLVGAAIEILRAAPSRAQMMRIAAVLLKEALDNYQFVSQKVILSRTLLLRIPDLPKLERATLERFARFDTSPRAILAEKWLAFRARRPTLNLEGLLLWSAVGTRLRNRTLRMKKETLTRRQTSNPGGFLLEAVVSVPRDASRTIAALPVARPSIAALDYGTTKWIHRNIEGLTLDVSPDYPKRVNLLLATINFDYVFGGYIGMFNLALRLKREGYRPRIILHEETVWDILDWKIKIRNYPGLIDLFDEVEVISRFSRDIPVEVSPDDRFVATNCWAAHIAHNTTRSLAVRRFLFMAQEYEPFFLPMNSISALFQQAYDLPQLTLFSTELLRDFFRRERIGIYAAPDGDRRGLVFSNAVQRFRPSRGAMERGVRRLLFYARPEEHAARNLFELGIMALSKLVREKRADLSHWTFHGLGSLGGHDLVLDNDVIMELVPKVSLAEYIDRMPSFDVGLSLMMTPHPSLVPIEMAAAGMWVVTNTFANKTAERLDAISSNILGVLPTVDAIVDGLLDAIGRVDELDRRLAGAAVCWPSDWNDAFPAETISAISGFLGAR